MVVLNRWLKRDNGYCLLF